MWLCKSSQAGKQGRGKGIWDESPNDSMSLQSSDLKIYGFPTFSVIWKGEFDQETGLVRTRFFLQLGCTRISDLFCQWIVCIYIYMCHLLDHKTYDFSQLITYHPFLTICMSYFYIRVTLSNYHLFTTCSLFSPSTPLQLQPGMEESTERIHFDEFHVLDVPLEIN